MTTLVFQTMNDEVIGEMQITDLEYRIYRNLAAEANLTFEEYINKAIRDGLTKDMESPVEDYGL